MLSSTKLACLSLKKEADVDSRVIPEAFPEHETGFSESQNGGFLDSSRRSFKHLNMTIVIYRNLLSS